MTENTESFLNKVIAQFQTEREQFLATYNVDLVPIIVAFVAVIGVTFFLLFRRKAPVKQSWRPTHKESHSISSEYTSTPTPIEEEAQPDVQPAESEVQSEVQPEVHAPPAEEPPILESEPIQLYSAPAPIENEIPVIEPTTTAASPSPAKSPKVRRSTRKSEPVVARSGRLRSASPVKTPKVKVEVKEEAKPVVKREIKEEEEESSDSDAENQPPQTGKRASSRKSDLPVTPRRSSRTLKEPERWSPAGKVVATESVLRKTGVRRSLAPIKSE